MSQAINELILGPMMEVYQPPDHLRNHKVARLKALSTYEKVLDGFDRPTLERAWKRVVAGHTDWCWPSPGVIADA